MTLRLKDIKSPSDLRGLRATELKSVAREIRETILDTVSANGGHLASSLGVVELTLALHTSFDTPNDKIVWDVGHQSYAHKLLTGRFAEFHTLRTYGGLSGYPKRQESPYDIYDTGHASGSISYALGLAKARDLKGGSENIVAVIGDGALTSGVAYEGLNNAGELRTRLIVVVNDNSMSISENVGGMSYYLTTLRLAPLYRSTKARFQKALALMPALGKRTVTLLRRLKGGLKHFLFPESWFESLGFRYYGPIDGHDIEAMQRVFKKAQSIGEPVIVHVVTKKGKGYARAEAEPEKYHGPGPFDKTVGIVPSNGTISWNKVFGQAITHFAGQDERIVAITAAMSDGTGLGEFRDAYPDRFFDVGIAESHAVTYAAGLAQAGLLPVVAIYSTFLQRGYDQIIQDVAQQGLKVVFAIDRAGIVGEDGETHHGEFDLSYLRPVPGLTIMAPKDERELVNMLYTSLRMDGSVAIRYPRGRATGAPYEDALHCPSVLEVGKAEVLTSGRDAHLIALGSMVAPAVRCGEILKEKGISCGVVNARFVRPLDLELMAELARVGPLFIAEENVAAGGLGDEVASALADRPKDTRGIHKIALPASFISHGNMDVLRKTVGLDALSMAERIAGALGRQK